MKKILAFCFVSLLMICCSYLPAKACEQDIGTTASVSLQNDQPVQFAELDNMAFIVTMPFAGTVPTLGVAVEDPPADQVLAAVWHPPNSSVANWQLTSTNLSDESLKSPTLSNGYRAKKRTTEYTRSFYICPREGSN